MRMPLAMCLVLLLAGASPYTNQSVEMQRLAKNGDTDAMLCLADDCAYGKDGAPRDSKLALEWYRKAAEGGNAQAQARYGRILFCGALGATKDTKLFSFWTQKALKHEEIEALLLQLLREKIGLATLMYIDDNGKTPTSLKDLKDGFYTDKEVPDEFGRLLRFYGTTVTKLKRDDILRKDKTVMVSFADPKIPDTYIFIMADGSLRGETGKNAEAAAASAGLAFLK